MTTPASQPAEANLRPIALAQALAPAAGQAALLLPAHAPAAFILGTSVGACTAGGAAAVTATVRAVGRALVGLGGLALVAATLNQ